MSAPQTLQDQLFARVRMPTIQTDIMAFATEETATNIGVVCTDAYADLVSAIDDHLCSCISASSQAWFGKAISHDNVENMMQASLVGHRNPKHTLDATKCKCFVVGDGADSVNGCLSPCDIPASGAGTLLVRCDGVLFNKTTCEMLWSVLQMKCEASATPDTASDDDDDPDDSPMFL